MIAKLQEEKEKIKKQIEEEKVRQEMLLIQEEEGEVTKEKLDAIREVQKQEEMWYEAQVKMIQDTHENQIKLFQQDIEKMLLAKEELKERLEKQLEFQRIYEQRKENKRRNKQTQLIASKQQKEESVPFAPNKGQDTCGILDWFDDFNDQKFFAEQAVIKAELEEMKFPQIIVVQFPAIEILSLKDENYEQFVAQQLLPLPSKVFLTFSLYNNH